ncbi:MAG: glycosyltransferase [Anaerolineae bacterium]|nr:glycosyltransferase [Anaerolineae bacterium]NUQ04317.1 glycosyltransferase [Anaerolineae bacterium]
MPKTVCVITLALPIETDPRSFRQIERLSRDYAVRVIGFGDPPASWAAKGIAWHGINRSRSRLRLAVELILLALGRLIPAAYDLYFWRRPRYVQALRLAIACRADAYHASDWAAIPLAVRAARQTGGTAKVFFDADEHWTTERESSRAWRWFFAPMIHHFLSRYAAGVDASTHVSEPLAERYAAEYGLGGGVVYNAPDYVETPDHPVDPQRIRLIFHGAAIRNRHLEVLIDAIALCQPRFELHFLVVGEAATIDGLKAYAQENAPERVIFRPPVSIHQVVQAIADCDLELSWSAPTTYTNRYTLPNKLFEAAVAGLGVIVGPGTAHEQMVTRYSYGIAARSFSAADLAATVNALSVEQVMALRAAARRAGQELHAEVALEALSRLYREVLG